MGRRFGLSIVIMVQLLFLFGCGGAAPSGLQTTNGGTGPGRQPAVSQNVPEQTEKAKVQASVSEAAATTEVLSGLDTLNAFRTFAGMTPLARDAQLEKAAANHARYLVANDLYTHYESAGDPYFTGSYPSSRVAAAGYPHHDISENIYAGDVTPQRSVEILFSNIYHRLAFLDFGFDEIGLAEEESQAYRFRRVFTYEMGREESRVANEAKNPEIVLWPAPGQSGVMPVFYEEIPDPLPECSVSGYPISVQFNPQKSGLVELLSFRLFDAKGEEITDTILMDSHNDPSGHLDNRTFVLFPLSRLEWGSRYHIEVAYREEGGDAKTLKWDFTTKMLPGRLIRVESAEQHFTIKSGESCYFYLPPENCNDTFTTYHYRYSAGLRIEERIRDNNTIMLKATGSGEIEITPDNGRKFYIHVSV